MPSRKLRILVARHSAFYSPLIATLSGGFLDRQGIEASYGVLPAGARSRDLLRSGEVDIVQSAVSSSWGPLEQGESDLPVHFAQINQRDGFFLAARRPDSAFDWKKLQGATLLADHGSQPLAMLKYAAWRQGVDWGQIRVVDAGDVEQIDAAFRAGQGDYVHQQGPAPQQLEHDRVGWVVASVGEAMPAVAFSSLSGTREFLRTDQAARFLAAYAEARIWARRAPASDVAQAEAGFFPGIAPAALQAAIARYQHLGCWEGDLAIERSLYQQALEVFFHSGLIRRRYAYEEVVANPVDLEGPI